MFSGQGSQYYQMGRELFIHEPVFRDWMFKLDNIAKEIGGDSVIAQIYNDKKRVSEQFNRTLYTNPAIIMVEYAMAQVLLEAGIIPDFVMGSSLGEFTAAALAGCMGIEEVLESVIILAQILESRCPSGRMLAIIHDCYLFNNTALMFNNSELASINYKSHFVISGITENLNNIEKFLKSEDIICQMLPVPYGFHSSAIDSAATDYLIFLRNISPKIPRIPMVSSLYSTELTHLSDEYFWQVIRKPIRLQDTIVNLEIGHKQNLVYIDLGPGGTMANFVKRNLEANSESELYEVMTPFNKDLTNLDKIKNQLGCNA